MAIKILEGAKITIRVDDKELDLDFVSVEVKPDKLSPLKLNPALLDSTPLHEIAEPYNQLPRVITLSVSSRWGANTKRWLKREDRAWRKVNAPDKRQRRKLKRLHKLHQRAEAKL